MSKIQTTELVTIDSSVPRGIGPQPRVIIRKNGHYMLPRSPESPTSLRIGQSAQKAISGSFHARRANNYVSTKVSELKVDVFQIVPLPSVTKEKLVLPSSWSPTFPDIQVKGMNIHHVPTFNPLNNHVSSFSQLLSLDTLLALGLAEDEFWKLFSKCSVCHNFMTTRTVPYHICPTIEGGSTKVGLEDIPMTFFLRMLDVHDVGHEGGVPKDVFRAIFYTCRQCGCYMTDRVSFNHNEGPDCDSDDEPSLCIYLRAGTSKF